MQRLWKKINCFGWMFILLAPSLALAAAEKAAPLVVVADNRRLTGWESWYANLYNESHVYFTLITVISIPIIGLLFGVLADLIMGHIGIDLHSRELAEH
jgi:hypothetical protein